MNVLRLISQLIGIETLRLTNTTTQYWIKHVQSSFEKLIRQDLLIFRYRFTFYIRKYFFKILLHLKQNQFPP